MILIIIPAILFCIILVYIYIIYNANITDQKDLIVIKTKIDKSITLADSDINAALEQSIINITMLNQDLLNAANAETTATTLATTSRKNLIGAETLYKESLINNLKIKNDSMQIKTEGYNNLILTEEQTLGLINNAKRYVIDSISEVNTDLINFNQVKTDAHTTLLRKQDDYNNAKNKLLKEEQRYKDLIQEQKILQNKIQNISSELKIIDESDKINIKIGMDKILKLQMDCIQEIQKV